MLVVLFEGWILLLLYECNFQLKNAEGKFFRKHLQASLTVLHTKFIFPLNNFKLYILIVKVNKKSVGFGPFGGALLSKPGGAERGKRRSTKKFFNVA